MPVSPLRKQRAGYDFAPRLPCPAVRPAGHGERGPFVLTEPYSVTVDGVTYEFLPGLPTNGATGTRPLAWLIGGPYSARLLPFALPHDGLYASQLVSRSTADRVLRAVALQNGAPLHVADTFYAFVRGLGWMFWASTTEEYREYNRQFVHITPS